VNGVANNEALAQWTQRLSGADMPIFGHTVQEVIGVCQDEKAPSAELARALLHDASMTARVLKLVNTAIYNPRMESVNTISRAVVVLGFDTVRDMCLSIALVDTLVQGAPREHLTRELARAFHAAVQARAIAAERSDNSPEEVFIATLLYRVGRLAFWCFAGEQGDELAARMQQPGCTPESAEEEILGFRLGELTANLVREWRVSDLLRSALTNPQATNGRADIIDVSHRLATAAERGWNSPAVQEITQEIGKLIGLPTRDTAQMLHGGAREAAHIAGYYGATTAAKVIPLPGRQQDEPEEPTEEVVVAAHPEPDNMLQLKILRELSSFVGEGNVNFNLVMELVLEGIYRGVGMDRTLFALMTPDRRGLRAKFMLGAESEQLVEQFHFTRHPQHTHLLFATIDKQVPIWADVHQAPELRPLIPTIVTEVLGPQPFFVAPIVVGSKSIGLFYADRSLSGRDLDKEAFEGFRYFVQQCNTGLTALSAPANGGR